MLYTMMQVCKETGMTYCFSQKATASPNQPSALSSEGKAYPALVPIDEGSVIDLGGGVTVDVFNLGGHSENSVVFS